MRRDIPAINILIPAVILFLALVQPGWAADQPSRAPSAEVQMLKDKGLIQDGNRMVLPVEAEVHDAVKSLKVARAKQIVESNSRKELDGSITKTKQSIKDIDAEYARLNGLLSTVPDPAQQNQVIGRINYTVAQAKAQRADFDVMVEKEKTLTSAREADVDKIEEISKKIDAYDRAYDGILKDAEVASALAEFNKTARIKLKAGPSAYFSEDLAFIHKCIADVSVAVVPISTEHGVPEVQATINGKTKTTMVWDSGASEVSIGAELANKLGLHPTDKDPIVKAKLADGRIILAHKMTLKSIQVGMFTVNDVECLVLPRDLKEADPLLGDSFQSHFLAKLDQNSGELRLTPLDGSAVAKGSARSAAGEPN